MHNNVALLSLPGKFTHQSFCNDFLFLIKLSGLKFILFPHINLMTSGFFLRFYLFTFRERRKERKREGKKQQCARDTPISHLLHAPSWGPCPQSRYVP